ncbi:hypothetical protein N9K72_04355 [Pontimonas sp.]|nr:hypothetical protein [Pontimonas sp.]
MTDAVTVVVTTNLIPSAPDTSVIAETLKSLEHLVTEVSYRVLVVGDGLKTSEKLRGSTPRWNAYKKNLESLLLSRTNTSLYFRKNWGHISQTLLFALRHINTEYVLIVQHDLPFIRDLDLDAIIAAMRREPKLKHVRFNLRSNFPDGQDGGTTRNRGRVEEDRQWFFQQHIGPLPDRLPFIRTLSWSDNNFICSAEYLSQTILGPIGASRVAPEWVFNSLGTEENHEVLGTYVFGAVGDPPAIRHTDGRHRGQSRPLPSTKSANRRIFWTIRRAIQLELHRAKINMLHFKAQASIDRTSA